MRDPGLALGNAFPFGRVQRTSLVLVYALLNQAMCSPN